MTDRQPDDLYDALRDRLADYGQEPPAPLWASIRAQLPPPVAAPRPRQRMRRRALAALALLLLVGLGTQQWWRPDRRPGRRLATRVATTPPAPTFSPPAGLPSAAGRTAPALDNTIRRASAEALGHDAVVASGAAGGSSTKPAATAAGVAMASSQHRFPAAAAFIPAPQPRALATAQATEPGAGVAEHAASKFGIGTLMPRAAATPTLAVVRPVARARGDTPAATQFPARTWATIISRENAARAAARLAVPAAVGYQLAGILAETLAEPAQELPPLNAVRTQAAGQPAEPQVATLLRQPCPAPVRLARADTLPPRPLATVRRWAVQVVAGPALSARTLGAEQRFYPAIPNSNSYPPANNSARNILSVSSPENEQAATGFGAEGQLHRQLNGRWSLGTGLGYHAFATSQPVNVRVVYGSPYASTNRTDSVGTMSVRDTYHFLTVPLRVGYQLGSGRARLRYGLRAGADLAIYLGGHSTEGSAYGATSRSWGANGSPYRPLSLALSLGAEVRYQLAPSWELLAQPTLTHFVTSVARPSSGYVPRYPLAATALVGVAYWLR